MTLCRRYNTLVADETGLTLQLLPMLLGFFTYKGAVVARQSLALFNDLTAGYRGDGSGGESGDGQQGQQQGGEGGSEDVSSVDRAFAKKILQN